MKQKIFCSMLLAMLGCMPCFANLSLLIHLTDSTEIVCSLAKEPTMTFGDKTITLSSIEGTVGQWDFSDVVSWNFADVEDGDAVIPINAEKARIWIEGGRLTIAGVSAEKIAVYDAGGRSSIPVPDNADGQISININGLPKGTYLLKAGNSSIKFLVQ